MVIKDFKGKGIITIRIANLSEKNKQALLHDGFLEDVEIQMEIKELKINEE